MKRSKGKKILIWAAIAAFAAAQAVGLFFLTRVRPAASLTLSETSITLKLDEGRQIAHTIEPASAAGKQLSYSVSTRIAWVDNENDMVVALAPGTCKVRAAVDGQEAFVDVTVTEETILAGTWRGEGVALSLDGALQGRLKTASGSETMQWLRGVLYEGETRNPNRYVKLTCMHGDALWILYYDRMNDTLRLKAGDAADRILVRK